MDVTAHYLFLIAGQHLSSLCVLQQTLLTSNCGEWPQPHGCPTAPAWQHPARENKGVLLVQLGTGGPELCTCLLIALFLWAAVDAHAKGVFSILHPLLVNAEECTGTTAAWHLSECIWSWLSLVRVMWDRAGPQGRAASREFSTSQPLAGGPSASSHMCWHSCPLLPCSREPEHPFLSPSPCSAFPFLCTECASAPRLYLHSPRHRVSL